ncbi:MAG: heme o synthase [Actinomycetota bacterium]|nr:heme o synthase [Actinomycetota bacterium]
MIKTRFQKLSIATAGMTVVLIGVGGLVRATGSGLGCPGWPKCFGRWIPPLEYHAIIEYSHRLAASMAITLVGALAVAALGAYRKTPAILWPALFGVVLVFVQAGLGAAVVNHELSPWLVTVHFATAMILLAVVTLTLVNSFCALTGKGRPHFRSRFSRFAAIVAAATFGLLLIGAYVRGAGAGLAFPDWPLMNGRLVPHLGGAATDHFAHRAMALVVGILIVMLIRQVRSSAQHRDVRLLANTAGVLFLAQALAGAANVWSKLAAPTVVAHVVLSALTWGSVLGVALLSRRLDPETAFTGAPSFAARARAYYALTKPRIILLLLVTTVPTMILAAKGVPRIWLIVATLVGGTLAAGSANSINCYIDRDIDSVMARTKGRPLPAHTVEPSSALVFGVTLGFAAFGWLTWQVNLLSAALSVAAILFYVFVYTIGLKRSTPQNIVIGGAAGAVPVLVGWAAVTGRLAAAPVMLFLIIYYWTPPHFWALAMKFSPEYEAAKIPMLPVIASVADTTRQIMLYSLLLFAVTLLLYPVAKMGVIYLVAAVVLGGAFLWHALKLRRTATTATAMGLFKYSITYLTLLFGAVALDTLVHIAA